MSETESPFYFGSIRVRNHALFEDFEMNLKLVTILVGRNASGKSILLDLIWLLISLDPDFDKWSKEIEEKGGSTLIDKIISKAEKGENIEKEFKELVKIALTTLPKAYEEAFNEKFTETFGLGPEIFSRDNGLTIELRGMYSDNYSVKIYYDKSSGRFRIEYLEPSLFTKCVDELEVKVTGQAVMRGPGDYQEKYYYLYEIKRGESTIDKSIMNSDEDIIGTMTRVTGEIFLGEVSPWFRSSRRTFFSVDGRAGFIRAIMRPWIKTDELGLMYPDKEFVRNYFYLAELLYRNKIKLDIIKDILPEIGVENISAKYERGFKTIYVKLRNGLEIPLDIAPSGIREVLTPLLALSAEDFLITIIEEPEAHLHLSAVLKLGEVIARAVDEMFKLVLFSTHSDNLLIKISHLIEASKLDEKTREKMGLRYWLYPDAVAVYLLRFSDRDSGRTVVERVSVSDEGIDEKEMSRIVMELVNESSFIKLAKEKRSES